MSRRVLALVMIVAGCSAPPESTADVGPAGHLFIVGGGSRSPELMQRFIDLAGGEGHRIAVIPMASSEAEETGEWQVDRFEEIGAYGESVFLTREEAVAGAGASAVRNADGIWFSGGDQARLAAVLRGTPVLAAILERYREGAVVGGTSAGAAVMSARMLTGSQVDPEADTMGYLGDVFPRLERDMMELAEGFGLLPGALVDQHFVRRERMNRLLAAVLSNPDLVGVGIDESTALIVRPDGAWEVVGESVALVMDARAAVVTAPEAATLGAESVHLHVLPPGSLYRPSTGAVTLPGLTGSK